MVLQYNLCVVKAWGFVIASRACSLTNTRRGTLKKSLGRDVPPRPLLRHKLCISPPCSLFGTTNVDPSPGDPSSPTFKLFYTCKGRKRLISSRELLITTHHTVGESSLTFFLISIRLNSLEPWPYIRTKFKS